MTIKKETEIGKCAVCGSENLDYNGIFEIIDDGGFYPYSCGECDFEGREWYNLTFVGHSNFENCEII